MNSLNPASFWLSNLSDYCQMFCLSEQDLSGHILDYPHGVSSFNVEYHSQFSGTVVSRHPIFALAPDEMRAWVASAVTTRTNQLLQQPDALNPGFSLDDIAVSWQKRAATFLEDYTSDAAAGRYQNYEAPSTLPTKPYYDLVLCASDLFLNERLSVDDQIDELMHLSQRAAECRIFPLQSLDGTVPNHLGLVMAALQRQGCGMEVRAVPYRECRGGNAMLRFWATECQVGRND